MTGEERRALPLGEPQRGGWSAALARAAGGFLAGSGFPVFVLSLLAALWLMTVGTLLVPAGDGALAGFAEDFRRWCFGWREGTGYDAGWLLSMLGAPLGLATVTILAWWEPLRELRGAPAKRWARPAITAAACAAVLWGALVALEAEPAGADLAFPASSLRTRLPPPPVDLVDHEGRGVDLEDLRGRVVLLTSVYARCSETCPMIFAQAKDVVGALTETERADLSVVAVTLDPQHDDVERLAALADAHGLEAPTWRLATGEPEVVEATLDRMGVARSRDPESGLIDHANVFLLIDRRGRVAYRFTLGDLQRDWMLEALRLLVAEGFPEA